MGTDVNFYHRAARRRFFTVWAGKDTLPVSPSVQHEFFGGGKLFLAVVTDKGLVYIVGVKVHPPGASLGKLFVTPVTGIGFHSSVD